MEKVFYIYKNGFNVGQEKNGIRALLRIERETGEKFDTASRNKYLPWVIRYEARNGDIWEARKEEIKP